MAPLPTDLRVGKRLCVKGWGTANLLHTHAFVVERVTTTLVVAVNDKGHRRRFRLRDGHCVPRDTWGGSTAATTCQKEA